MAFRTAAAPDSEATDGARLEPRDYYAVLGASPGATAAELRTAFREAVLRHHPDVAASSALANRRTAILNRAWSELRDPLRRLHYDRRLELGTADELDWPLDEHEVPRRTVRTPRGRRLRPEAPSRWHQPQWRSVAGFRVPADVFLAGPIAQRRWIVEHHIAGQDWRQHSERYWLRYAAGWYRERGLTDDWLGAIEQLVELDESFETMVQVELRDAYTSAGAYLRGAAFLRRMQDRYEAGTAQRRWVDRELRALLALFRERMVRRGRPAERAERAELLLNYLEALEAEPSFADVRAAIIAHRRAGNAGRAAELIERAVEAPVTDPARWYSLVQLLTEAGQLDRASTLLAAIARGAHPAALDARRIGGDPVRRIAAARTRLGRARDRAARAAERRAERVSRGAQPA